MSSSALTIPGKWSSFNSSTVHHINTRHPSFRSPRSDVSKLSTSQDVAKETVTETLTEQKKMAGDKKRFQLGEAGQATSELGFKIGTTVLPELISSKRVDKNLNVEQMLSTTQRDIAFGSEEAKSTIVELSDLLREYETKIKKLDTDKKQMVRQINALHSENKSLRMHVDSAGKPGVDSYTQLLQDRKLLRESEASYKSRIAKLEKEVKERQIEIQNITEENKKLKNKTPRLTEQHQNQSKYNELYWRWNALKKENDKFRKALDLLDKFKSESSLHVLLGRGTKLDFSSEEKRRSHVENQTQYNTIYEERNALKIENKRMKRENESLRRQIRSIAKESQLRDNDRDSEETETEENLNDYKKLYSDSDKKAQLYKRITQLEHENIYLSLSNSNLLREIRQLQTR